MANTNQALKVCPSCTTLVPADKMKKVVSRSWGKTTKTLRCMGCIRRAAAIKAAKKE